MDEQRGRLERAVRWCAEDGVPDGIDLWPRIRERVGRGRPTGTQVSEEPATSDTTSRSRRRWPFHLVPNTPLGYALAVLSLLIVGAGAYAASGPVGELLRYGLPGPGDPASGSTREEETSPGIDLLTKCATHGCRYAEKDRPTGQRVAVGQACHAASG